jgi:hypothetical protein
MKTYNWTQLKNLVKEQSYKMAALQNQQGERIVPFNAYKKNTTNLDAQFNLFQTRLKNEMNPDGVYFVLLAHSINHAKDAHPYAIVKGKVKPEDLAEAEKKALPLTQAVTIVQPGENVLSWEKAVEMNKTIADQAAKIAQLEFEIKALNQSIADYESEEGLSEPEPVSNTVTFFKEALPSLSAMADRFFNLEEKKLDLKVLELQNKGSSKSNGHAAKDTSGAKRKPIVPGTQDHLNLIEHYFNTDQDEKRDAELDKLQAVNPKLYQDVLKTLELEEEEEEEEEEGGEN